MTWKEFKNQAESDGIKDNDEIFYIDIHLPDEIEAFYYKDTKAWIIS